MFARPGQLKSNNEAIKDCLGSLWISQCTGSCSHSAITIAGKPVSQRDSPAGQPQAPGQLLQTLPPQCMDLDYIIRIGWGPGMHIFFYNPRLMLMCGQDWEPLVLKDPCGPRQMAEVPAPQTTP